MKISWTKGLLKDTALSVRQNYKESLVLRRRLVDMLEEKVRLSMRASRAEAAYENPNWALMQADSRGYERAMQEVVGLINDNSVDNPS
jgi:hypothetical protein